MQILFVIGLFILPLLELIGGGMMRFFPPKKQNHWIGYRTELSCKNQEMWDYAQRYCGTLWLILGMSLLAIAVAFYVVYFWILEKEMTTTALVRYEIVHVMLALGSILLVERELKSRFDKDGKRIDK